MITPTDYNFPPKTIIFTHGIYGPVPKGVIPRIPLYTVGNILTLWGPTIPWGNRD